uniref:Uncharacterized protein n=1 Tax=Vitis vinifera TaxID=29760 RepID=F6HGD0_VITVI
MFSYFSPKIQLKKIPQVVQTHSSS